MKRTVTVVAMILVWALLPNRAALAQCEGEEISLCASGRHKLSEGDELEGLAHPNECRSCLSGPPSVCHPPCSLLVVAESEAYKELWEAAQRGDLLSVLTVGRRVPSLISYNEKRFSVQITGCDGMLVANLPVPPDAGGIVSTARKLTKEETTLGLASVAGQRK